MEDQAADVARAILLLQQAQEVLDFQREEMARLRLERDQALQLKGRLDAILELLTQLLRPIA